MTDIVVNSPQEIIDKVKHLAEQYPAEMERAVWMELSRVLEQSKILCPYDTGNLRGSGYVSDPVVGYGQILASIGYSANYAGYVHENLLANHKSPTQAKFLEVPLIDAAPMLLEKIAERVETLLVEG